MFGQTIDVGVYRSHDIQRIDFTYYDGSYFIFGDTTPFGTLQPNEYISVAKTGSKVELKRGNTLLGTFKTIRLVPTQSNLAIRLKPRIPIVKERSHFDSFTVFAGVKGLTIVNNVSYKHYLEGVLESEGGGGKPLEYYKAQAVISRTYSLRHISKHQKEGFNLCDQVHCQAYFNKPQFSADIIEAVRATDGVFIVDTLKGEPIESFFFANCGGETSRADYVWKQNISYLQPIIDTFCIHTKQATWEKRILKSKWRDFFVSKYYYPIKDSIYREALYYFEQPSRKAFYLSPHLGIPLRDIRYHFNLKSTFFSVRPEGEYVVLEGRGFGHGVGLCQEGAMGMAKNGFNYQQILRFYYGGISFRHYFEELFFDQAPVDSIDF